MSLACLTANQMSFIDNFVGKEQFAGWPPSDAKWSPNRGMPFEGSGELSMRNYYCRLDGMFADIDINVIKKVKTASLEQRAAFECHWSVTKDTVWSNKPLLSLTYNGRTGVVL